MNPKVAKVPVLSLVLGLLFSVPLRAQVVGATLSGTITDPGGGAIPNAKVSAKNLATDLSTSTTTNATGAYSIANLNPADYEVSSSAPGFSTAVTKVTLTVGAKQEVNLALKVGQVTQVVEITGAAPSVETTNSTLSAEVNSTTVNELPLNGRDWASLAALQPGVAGVRTQEVITQVGAIGRGLGSQLSIDGNRPTQNSYRLNGIFINDYSNAGPGNVLGANLGVDAIQEFSVITSNYSAEYGYTSGGIVNAVTKSGTNQFHGSTFEFIRNNVLDAANFFENFNQQKRAPFRRNQFGASAGGPIKKDKIFIFGAYEGLRQSKGIPHTVLVPSESARAGILSTGNITVSQPYLTFFPHCPASANIAPGDLCNFAFSGAQVVPDNYGNIRGDVKISDKDSLSASFYYDRSTFTQPDAYDQVLDGFFVARKGASLEETHLFGSSFVNTVRLGWNYTQGFGQLTPSAINPDAASTSSTFAIEPGLHAARIATIGGGPITAAGFNQAFAGGLNGNAIEDFTHQTVQTFDDAGLTVGKHSLKFGFMFVRLEEKLFAPFTSNGTAQFASLSDFLTDTPSLVQSPPVGGIATVKTHYTFASIPAVYLQDDWKVRPNLTLNLGLRYEMETIPTDKFGLIANLPFLWTNPTTPNCSTCRNTYFLTNPTKKNFEPRVGFAWDPFHNGKTSVRGGFGLFDALPLPYELALNNAQTSPFHVNVTVPGCLVNGVASPPPCIAQGQFPNVNAAVLNLFLTPGAAPLNTVVWNYVDSNIKRNYIYQWNLNLQRQLAGNLSLTLAYAGSRGKHNPFQTDELNTVFPTLTDGRWLFPGNPVCSASPAAAAGCGSVPGTNPTGIVPGKLINPNVAEIQSTLWQSKSWYDALQVELEKRMSHGFQVQASFTWSKTEDTSSGSFAGDNFAGDVSPTIPWWDLKIIKGLSDFNVSRNLVVNALWQVPTPASFHGPAAFIANGWEFGGIISLSGGVPTWPFSANLDSMGQLNSEPLALPDRVPGCSLINPSSGRHGSLQYINPACFTNALAPAGFNLANCDQAFITNFATNPANAKAIAAGTLQPLPANTCINLLGDLGRNTIVGPGLVNVDYSMIKDTKIPKISENFTVQFRAEFFNLFNHANFAPPVDNLVPFDGTGLRVGTFGQLTRTQSPERQIQFGLKLIW
jgi:carboxypeptidase family protein/TonB-dependent receptor-like protein